jgi:Icc-related predicted phosphoesterase
MQTNTKPPIKITFISDTHGKHRQLDLPGGDVLVHAGDVLSNGNSFAALEDFCEWASKQSYSEFVFIAGNHDLIFETNPDEVAAIVNKYPIKYIEESFFNYLSKSNFSVWGTPYQPAFNDWAFNLPVNSKELQSKWYNIPVDTDLLITHNPPQSILDQIGKPWFERNKGCEMLLNELNRVEPKIHLFGHIHGGFGYEYLNGTHFINASVLDEFYHVHKGVKPYPPTANWFPEDNTLLFE